MAEHDIDLSHRINLRFDNSPLIDRTRIQVDFLVVQDCNGSLRLTFADGTEVETNRPPSQLDPRIKFRCSLLLDRAGEAAPQLSHLETYEYYNSEREICDIPDRVHKWKD